MRDVADEPGREVIEHCDFSAIREKAIGEMRTNETSATGDQEPHFGSVRPTAPRGYPLLV
jgi:hypothetical protein